MPVVEMQLTDCLSMLQVKKLLAKGNIDLAQANLDREGQVAELKNQIAIIRYISLLLISIDTKVECC